MSIRRNEFYKRRTLTSVTDFISAKMGLSMKNNIMFQMKVRVIMESTNIHIVIELFHRYNISPTMFTRCRKSFAKLGIDPSSKYAKDNTVKTLIKENGSPKKLIIGCHN